MAEELGFNLVDVSLHGQGKRTMLRVTIDRDGGVSLDDCEHFSRGCVGLMDVEDPIVGPYTLEVSSPGLDRPLKTPDDFKRNVGKLLRVVTKEKINNQSFFLGRLTKVSDGSVTLSLTGKKRTTVEIDIPFDMISKAQIEIEVK